MKPFRFYDPAVQSYSRNHTTQGSRPPTQARRFTADTHRRPRHNSINRQPLLSNPQPVNNATNNGRIPHFPTSNQHQQQIPDVNNSQQHKHHQHQTPILYNAHQHIYKIPPQQYSTVSQVHTHRQYDAAAAQSADYSAYHASAPSRGNNVPTYMATTRSLPYPVGDQYTTTTTPHLPYQQHNIHVTDNRLPYLINNSSVTQQC